MNRATAATDMAIFQYTSGTTRELPDAIKHTHRAVVVVMNAALYGTGLRPGDRFFCPSSPAWGHGLWHGTLAPLALGIETGAYAGKFDAERLLQRAAGLRHDQPVRRGHALSDDEEHRPHRAITARSCESFRSPASRSIRKPLRSSRPRSASRCAACTAPPRSASSSPTIPAPRTFAVKPGSLGRPVPGVDVEVQRPDGSTLRAGRARRDQGAPPRRLVPHQGSRPRRCRRLFLPRRPSRRRHHLRRLDHERGGDRGRTAGASGRAGAPR